MRGHEEKRTKELSLQRNESTAEEKPILSADTAQAGGGQGAGEAVTTQKEGTACILEVKRAHTISSGDLWHRVEIKRQELPVDCYYETTPELLADVYLKGSLHNTTGFPLFPGQVSIYRNGSFMGRTRLNYIAEGQEFALSFGIDEELRVIRTPLTRPHKRQKNLTRHYRFWDYQFILYNYKDTRQVVTLREAIYHSTLDEIEVGIMDNTTKGYELSEEGILSWKLSLPPEPFRYTKLELSFYVGGQKVLIWKN